MPTSKTKTLTVEECERRIWSDLEGVSLVRGDVGDLGGMIQERLRALLAAQPTAIRNRVDLIGCNHKHIREYVSQRRPDVAGSVDGILDAALGGFGGDKTKEGIMALMALAYSAGRASVIAEVEGITITDVCKDGY